MALENKEIKTPAKNSKAQDKPVIRFLVKTRNTIIGFLSVFIVLFISISLFLSKSISDNVGFWQLAYSRGFFSMSPERWNNFVEERHAIIFVYALLLTILFFVVRRFAIRLAIPRLQRCEKCKWLFVLKKIKSDFIRSEDISILVKLQDKNRNGEVTGTREQYIPGERRHYTEFYHCKHCGYEKEVHRTKVIKKV